MQAERQALRERMRGVTPPDKTYQGAEENPDVHEISSRCDQLQSHRLRHRSGLAHGGQVAWNDTGNTGTGGIKRRPAYLIKFYKVLSKVSFCLAERRQISYDR